MTKNFLKLPIELRNGYKDRKHLAKIAMMRCIACEIELATRSTRLEIHHKIGCGIGLKASDLLVIPLCNFHHLSGGRGFAIHSGLEIWEKKFGRQDDLILQIHDKLGIDIYKNFLIKKY